MKNEILQLAKHEYALLKENKDLTNNQIINKVIEKTIRYIYEDETNDIYIYFGSIDDNNRLYKNIELEDITIVPNSLKKKFEMNHIIIKPNNSNYQKTYNDIQKMFFKKAMRSNQEEAKKLVLTKFKR